MCIYIYVLHGNKLKRRGQKREGKMKKRVFGMTKRHEIPCGVVLPRHINDSVKAKWFVANLLISQGQKLIKSTMWICLSFPLVNQAVNRFVLWSRYYRFV